ncbi:dual 3',5'-cyclic-AMP and -GMP phosphodiesterase 11A [Octopus bimaculoides]|uniref:dual 3',5'-cyclic-AMP and -GMP phosphodiesterase 11A n=1 Tax=Octopus bimaculoides TaxID=37653 RepID=UPI0022E56DFA|nr:dual 3',5'-cyclic-AMP and -GMP phosphodiesterase 11A [Octopus bimaculoides]
MNRLHPTLNASKIESWLDANPESACDYFLRKADITLINKWLVLHGFQSLQEFIIKRKGSSGQESLTPTSPNDLKCNNEQAFFSESKHHRSNSKKHLRQDFAKSKLRNIFRTYCPSTYTFDSNTEARRSSLKEMRQFRSLPPTSLNMLSMLIESKIRIPRYPSKDIDMKREMFHLDEKDFFLEIVKDISNDLNLASLSAKIVANISILVDGDKGSLFLVDKSIKEKPVLVSKIFDVHSGTTLMPSVTTDASITVQWGKGIIGHVAEVGETVNIGNASKDPRYNDEVDRILGYKTESLLCMPIKNSGDEIVGIAQIINKRGGPDEKNLFTKEDEKLLATYTTFCGTAIQNAQLFDACSREYERNKSLLEVVHDLFEEQTNPDGLILKTMNRAQTLLKCERCSVFLRDGTSETSFKKVFDLANPLANGHSVTQQEEACNIGGSIPELVLLTGESINISDAYQDSRFDQTVDKMTGFHTRSILCKPIRNSDFEIIGVAEVVNRLDGYPFDDQDDQLFEAFAIFCGLGINNAILYAEVSLAAAKQQVALEMLSYHASITPEELMKLKANSIPETEQLKLTNLRFDDFSLHTDDMVQAGVRIFMDLGLLRIFRIDYETLCRWLLTIRKNYRNVAYHNWRHAFNVCQVMFSIVKTSRIQKQLSEKEVLALIVACLCHDLDHRGTNNAFQHKSSSALSQLYGTKATLEHHHFNHALMILNSDGHNLFANLSSEDYAEVINLLKQAILATDISLHLQIRSKFFDMIDNEVKQLEDKNQNEILRSILMTTCDIAAITKPWIVQRRVADLVMSEFFDQGDKERKELKIEPMAHMDRGNEEELPKLQLGWIDSICLPLYQALARLDSTFEIMANGVLENRNQWLQLETERLKSRKSYKKIETGV